MSRDFYKYIATRIVEFFRQESENMHNGDRFCLKLDNYEMVTEVNNALIEETASHSIQGTFALSDTYETYTIKLSDREIVVAAQIGDMTDDFFATLRNLTLDINPNPILMISCSPIDTITSATRDMSAKGMPFHADALVETIERDIKSSSSLASDDVYLLSHELNRVKRDRFADRKSLFEYKSFLNGIEPNAIIRINELINRLIAFILVGCQYPVLNQSADVLVAFVISKPREFADVADAVVAKRHSVADEHIAFTSTE